MKKEIIFIGFLGLALAILLSIYNVANATIHTVSTANDDASPNCLRILVSNASDGDTIRFAVPTVIVDTSSILISSDLKFQGENGVRVQAGNGFFPTVTYLFWVDSVAVVEMTDLELFGTGDFLASTIVNNGNLTMRNCTILGTSPTLSTPKIYQDHILNLENCTISGGTGGIADAGTVVSTSINSCTITDNDFGLNIQFHSPSIKNTIIANNFDSFTSANQNVSTSFLGGINSLGFNLIGTNDINFQAIGDTTGVDPKLNPLGDYKGTTQSHSLQFDSPAIDAGTSSGTPQLDQRGFIRLGNTDIGAVEFRQMQFMNASVTQTNISSVLKGTTQAEVIGIQILTDFPDKPISATQFSLNTNGTTNTSDISNAKLFYTGTNNSFSTTSQFGSTVASPSGSFNISGNQTLEMGTNYFWLTFDVNSNAIVGNKIDAQCTSIIAENEIQLVSPSSQNGDRTITGSIVVNIQNDENDSNCYDGDCSLRDALETISDGDSIWFATGIDTCDITLGQITANKNFTLNGTTADGTTGVLIRVTNGNNAAIEISAGKTAKLMNLVFQDGKDNAIKNGGALTITNCTVENSTGLFGGGIFNKTGATLTVESSLIQNNNSPTLAGGGIFNFGTLAVNNSTFKNNTTTDVGGGIYSNSGMTVTNSTFTGNHASGFTGPTFGGGAIFSAFGVLNISNSTISGNTATKSAGGIHSQSSGNITNCTITGNHANGTGSDKTGGLQVEISATINIKNTIISNNTIGANTLDNAVVETGSSLNSLGYNLEDGTDCGFTSTGDLQNTDAKLDTLKDNGGKTKTHALMLGSPAIGAGTNFGTPATDQRGFAVVGTRDIGSYEFGINTNGGNGSNPNPNSVGSGNAPNITLLPLIQNLDGTTPLASLQITNGSGGGSASMTTQLYNSQSSNAPNSVNFWWDIDVTGTWTADLTFSYAGLDLNGIDPNNLRVWHWNGSIWEDFGGTVNTIAQTITVPNLNQGNFSPFTLGGGDNPLAVELSYFKTESIKEGVKLIWRTESELNNKGFYIERKVEPNQFNRVSGLIEGQGTSASPYNYIFIDKHVKFGNTYTYRLIDVDSETGFEKEHREIKITFGSDGNSSGTEIPTRYSLHQNFPNPFNPNTTIKFDLPKARLVNLSIYNIKGQLVKTLVSRKLDAGFHSINWNGTDSFGKLVATGVYFYKIEAGSFRQIQKMTLLK